MKKLMVVTGLVGALGLWAFMTHMNQAEAYRMDNSSDPRKTEAVAARSDGAPSSAKADADLTEKIRTALLADTVLSATAKSATIVVSNGVVTLSGRVETDREKASVNAKALRAAAGRRIENQLVSDEQ